MGAELNSSNNRGDQLKVRQYGSNSSPLFCKGGFWLCCTLLFHQSTVVSPNCVKLVGQSDQLSKLTCLSSPKLDIANFMTKNWTLLHWNQNQQPQSGWPSNCMDFVFGMLRIDLYHLRWIGWVTVELEATKCWDGKMRCAPMVVMLVLEWFVLGLQMDLPRSCMVKMLTTKSLTTLWLVEQVPKYSVTKLCVTEKFHQKIG
jgi:hypothetical protein